MIQRERFDRVILAPIAQGGTKVEQWADEGFQPPHYRAHTPALRCAPHARFILWHQGEEPGCKQFWRPPVPKNLLVVVRTFREFGIDAPFYIALASRCGAPNPAAANVRADQHGALWIPRFARSLAPTPVCWGLNSVTLICHFNEAGPVRDAEMWADAL
jgi:hypothetical protein